MEVMKLDLLGSPRQLDGVEVGPVRSKDKFGPNDMVCFFTSKRPLFRNSRLKPMS